MEYKGHRPVQWGDWVKGAFNPQILATVAAIVTLVVVLGSLFRLAQLKTGGAAVAEGLGGRLLNRDTASHQEQQLLNVVEEMAIASGVQVPPVYVIADSSI